MSERTFVVTTSDCESIFQLPFQQQRKHCLSWHRLVQYGTTRRRRELSLVDVAGIIVQPLLLQAKGTDCGVVVLFYIFSWMAFETKEGTGCLGLDGCVLAAAWVFSVMVFSGEHGHFILPHVFSVFKSMHAL